MRLRIRLQCTQCGACAAICPDRAIARERKRMVTDAGRCRACEELETPVCVAQCPADAIRVVSEQEEPGKEMKR
ncbi:MAG: 4Fe-4S binding protein [Bryobacteraceae bacterium]